MLDTIILQLNYNQFYIENYQNFGTTKEEVLNYRGGFKKWYNNPTVEDKKNGIYKPRATLIKRGIPILLKLEFSAPKIIFGNNVDEIEESDFDLMLGLLEEKLLSMGIKTNKDCLKKSEIISFHPSKNIVIKGGYTSNFVIKELNKIDLDKRFDFDEKVYRNNGQVLQLYTNSSSLAIYDKMADLKKPAKRAIDKEQTIKQSSLFDTLSSERTELLRIEVRLSKKRKMNEILSQLSENKNPTLEEIFKKDLCKKIIKMYWDKFFSKNHFIFNVDSDAQAILQVILCNFPKIKIHQAYKLIGIFTLCRSPDGIKGLRNILERQYPKSNWFKIKKEFEVFENKIFTSHIWEFIKEIQIQINIFNSFKFKKL